MGLPRPQAGGVCTGARGQHPRPASGSICGARGPCRHPEQGSKRPRLWPRGVSTHAGPTRGLARLWAPRCLAGGQEAVCHPRGLHQKPPSPSQADLCSPVGKRSSSVDAGARGPGFPRRPAQARVEVLFRLRRPTGPLLASQGRGLGSSGAARPFSCSLELLTTHPGQYGTDGARGPGPQRGPAILRKGLPSPCRAWGPATQTGYLPGKGSNVLVGSWGSLPPSVCVCMCMWTRSQAPPLCTRARACAQV